MIDSAVIRRDPKVVYRELGEDEGGVLLHLETGQYHGLNKTGAAIWSLIDGVNTFAEIVVKVRGQLAAPPTDLEQDVTVFLDDLRQRDLIQWTASS